MVGDKGNSCLGGRRASGGGGGGETCGGTGKKRIQKHNHTRHFLGTLFLNELKSSRYTLT